MPSQEGLQADAAAALQYILSLRGDAAVDPRLIFAFGRSLGGAVAVQLANAQPGALAAVILENTFSSTVEMAMVIYGRAVAAVYDGAARRTFCDGDGDDNGGGGGGGGDDDDDGDDEDDDETQPGGDVATPDLKRRMGGGALPTSGKKATVTARRVAAAAARRRREQLRQRRCRRSCIAAADAAFAGSV